MKFHDTIRRRRWANRIARRLPMLGAISLLTACHSALVDQERSDGVSVGKTSQKLTGMPFLPWGAEWKYFDQGVDPGAGWNQVGWDDNDWKRGPAELGYGDGDEATVVSFGSSSSKKYTTTYFRTTFEIADPSQFAGVRLSVIRDDGVALYLNGTEVLRDNLPSSALSYATLASRDVGAPEESIPLNVDVSAASPGLLRAGSNLLAAEVHQGSASSSDLSFNAQVEAIPLSVVRGPYLQDGTSDSAVISWRTSGPTASRARWGLRPDVLSHEIVDTAVTTDHALRISGLEPGRTYYYAIGTDTMLLEGEDQAHFFVTLPSPGQPTPTRIWVLGDPSTGWGGSDPKAVRDAYLHTLGRDRRTDIVLFPGDQAYYAGQDYMYTRQVFDMYREPLQSTFSWSTMGNHDANFLTDEASIATAPYFNIYTLPTEGEAGGVPSHSERYYSFDYGNIHFVALDTQTMVNSVYPDAMLSWLEGDLTANTRQWVVAFFHKPPYSHGQHSSDKDADLTQVRTQIVPVLERHGVDLVLSGHSHAYERSRLLHGHYGPSTEFGDGSLYVVRAGDGRIAGTGPYAKPDRAAGPSANRGTVYVVAGSAGGIGGGALDHPAMVRSLGRLGSLVIDVDAGRMDVRFLRETGAIEDEFTILHGALANAPPTVSISTSPGEAGPQMASGTVTAIASDADGSVREVSFYLNGELLGTDGSSPFQADYAAVSPGHYQIFAVATDDRGSTSMSLPVNLEVPWPAPVLAATARPGSVQLTWNRTSSEDTKYRIDRATGSGAFEQVGAVWADRFTSYVDASLEPNQTYSYRVRAIQQTGESVSNEVRVQPLAGAPDVIVSAGARWKYLDNGTDQGTAWRTLAFDDGAWASGVSHLGYGDEDAAIDLREETVIGYGPDPKNKFITTYFRKWFYVSDKDAYLAQGVRLGQRVNRDDGAVVYLNEVEIGRTNMPTGSITYKTRASTPVEDQWWTKNNIPSNLVNGWNLIAAEVHQSDPTSSDISFDLELRKATPEVCDGYDNDVDGAIDEDYPKGASCAVGTGECQQRGVSACGTDGVMLCTNVSTEFPLDRTAPVVQQLTATPNVLTSNNHKFYPIALTALASDNCGAPPTCYILSVSSNEPCDDRGPKKLCPQWRVTDNMRLELLGERQGNGSDRVYTIQVVCRDARNNATRASTTVTVPH